MDIREVVPKLKGLLPDDYQFTGYCSDYLGYWVFPYIKVPFDFGGNGYLFVNKDTQKVCFLHPKFNLEDYLKAPIVLEPDEFDKLLGDA